MTDLNSISPVLPPDPAAAPAPAPVGLGHNNPPEPLPYDAVLHAAQTAKVEAFNDAATAWLNLGEIANSEQAEKLTDFLGGAVKLRKAVEAARDDAKRPWAEKAKAAYDAFNDLMDKITKQEKALKPMSGAWLIKVRAREEAERREKAEAAAKQAREAREALERAALNNDISGQVEAEKAAKEAEKAEKQAAKPVKVSAGSATGAARTISLRTVKEVEVTDVLLAFRHYRTRPEVAELLTRLAQADVRAAAWDGVAPPGCVVHTKEVAA